MKRNILILSILFFSISSKAQFSTSTDFSVGTGLSSHIDIGIGSVFPIRQLMYPFSSFWGKSGTPIVLKCSQNIHYGKFNASVFLGFNYYPVKNHAYNINVDKYELLSYGVDAGYTIITKPDYNLTPSVFFGGFRIVNDREINAPKQWLIGLKFVNELEVNEQISLLLTPSLQSVIIPKHVSNDLEYSQKIILDIFFNFGVRYTFGTSKDTKGKN